MISNLTLIKDQYPLRCSCFVPPLKKRHIIHKYCTMNYRNMKPFNGENVYNNRRITNLYIKSR